MPDTWNLKKKKFFLSSTSLSPATHLPPPSCTHAQSCNPMDCSPPGFSVHGLFQARILEWVAKIYEIEIGNPKRDSAQFSSVAQSCLTLCDPMNRSTPGLPVHHQFSEFTQTHVHRVSDAIQPSHSLSSPSPAPNLFQHQSFPMSQLFAWGGQSTRVSASASFLPKNTQDWPPSEWTCWVSLQSKGLSRVFSNTTVQKHQFFGAQLSSTQITILVVTHSESIS